MPRQKIPLYLGSVLTHKPLCVKGCGQIYFFSVASDSFWWTMVWCATKVDTIQEDLRLPVREALLHKGFGEVRQ